MTEGHPSWDASTSMASPSRQLWLSLRSRLSARAQLASALLVRVVAITRSHTLVTDTWAALWGVCMVPSALCLGMGTHF